VTVPFDKPILYTCIHMPTFVQRDKRFKEGPSVNQNPVASHTPAALIILPLPLVSRCASTRRYMARTNKLSHRKLLGEGLLRRFNCNGYPESYVTDAMNLV